MADETPAGLRAKGYFLLPLPPRQKDPPPRGWVTRRDPFEIPEGANVAIGLRGDVAVLITNDDQATAWAHANFGDPNVKSVRGAHWYFRAREGQANEPNRATPIGTAEFHVRNKYAIVPPSVHPSGASYAWVRPLPSVEELPLAPDVRELWHPKGEHHTKLLAMSAAAAHSGRNAQEILSDLRSFRDAHLPDGPAHPDRELLALAESAASKFRPPGTTSSTGDPAGEEDGAQLFRDLTEKIRQHYYFEDEWHYTICALFVMQSWVARAGALPAVFYLWFGGAFSSGKSNVLSLVSSLTEGLMLENVSPSALARVMENARTVLLDEIDVERGEELDDIMASLLRSGYRRNGPPYVRWNAKEKAADILPIFGPKAGTFRSALDPALQSRGFVIPTAKPLGESHYDLVLANLWPSASDLVPRLRAWGKRAASVWTSEALEALSRTEPFRKRVRTVVGELGANRESELLTIALLVAQMVPIDVTTSLSSARELRSVEISEDQAEAIEELRQATVATMSRTATFSNDGREIYRVAQKTVRDEVNRRRREHQERPLSTGRLALLRRELGVKDAWLAEHGHSLYWSLPKEFAAGLGLSGSSIAVAESSTAVGPQGVPDTSGSAPPPPPNPPSYSPTPPRTPPYELVAPADSRDTVAREEGSTRGVPHAPPPESDKKSSDAGRRYPEVSTHAAGALPEEALEGRGRHEWKRDRVLAKERESKWANPACAACTACMPPHFEPGKCTCALCSPWGHSNTAVGSRPHFCGTTEQGS